MILSERSTVFKWVLITLLLILISFNSLIGWFIVDQNQRFHTSHLNIAKTTVKIVSAEIIHFIEEKQYLVNIFAEDHAMEINRLADDTENEDLKDDLGRKIQRALPDSFTFTIANSKGEPLLDDFDGNIGEICISDMKLFLASRQKRLRIHPNVHLYHFDLIAPWNWNKNNGIFLINFQAEKITHILKSTSPNGHELIIVDKSQSYLIELFEQGPRNVRIRGDYRMTAENKARILSEFAIPNTQWTLLDLHEPDLFSAHNADAYFRLGMVALGFNLFFVLVFIVLIYIEIKRVQSEQFKDEMFSLFSHDLRSPLVSILGGLGLLANKNTLTEQEKKLLLLVEENAQIMHEIVDDILDIQKLESNKMNYDFKRQNIMAIARNVVELNKAYANKFEVALEYHCEDESVIVECDEKRITQTFTNLITNAVKFSPKNEPVMIDIKKDTRMVRISISDKGPGIPEKFQQHLFKKFSQSREGNVHSVSGTGLGLVIVKNIVLAHKGDIQFETSHSSGTTFIVSLPIVTL